jgi:hypothetical protein
MPNSLELTGDVGGKYYKVAVELPSGRVTRIWCRTTERGHRRAALTYWMPVWPRGANCRQGAGRRIGPVLEEAEASLQRHGYRTAEPGRR